MQVQASKVIAALTEPEVDAMVEVMLLAAFADGSIGQAESAIIKQSLLAADELWINHVDLETRMERAKQRMDETSREERLLKLRTMLPWPEQRVVAIKLATRIVAADGVIDSSERELILQAAEALGVRGDIAAELDALAKSH
jgi:uncharacterized tellurite resistance protein B-like protein